MLKDDYNPALVHFLDAGQSNADIAQANSAAHHLSVQMSPEKKAFLISALRNASTPAVLDGDHWRINFCMRVPSPPFRKRRKSLGMFLQIWGSEQTTALSGLLLTHLS